MSVTEGGEGVTDAISNPSQPLALPGLGVGFLGRSVVPSAIPKNR